MFADVPHWGWLAAGILSIPVLVALNGFFVAAEFALVAVRWTQVEQLVRQGARGAKAVEAAITNLDRTIAATQLGITLASIALGWVGERAMSQLLDPVFAFLPDNLAFASKHALAVAVAFTFVTFMHVVFGELIPKAIALQTPGQTALFVSGPLLLFSRLTRPVVYVMNGTGNWLVGKLGYNPSGSEGGIHSIEELRMLVEDTEEAGLIDPDAADMVLGVFALANKQVKDCLVPRDEMACLDVNTPSDKVMEIARLGAHTRLPVYDGTPDNVVGIVNTKDLFFLFSTQGLVLLEDALYPATFLKPEEPVANAFRLFRRTHRPMAIVRDSTGAVQGLITLEDVLEEIVGDIEDEHDVPVPKLKLPRRPGGPPRPGGKPPTGLHPRVPPTTPRPATPKPPPPTV